MSYAEVSSGSVEMLRQVVAAFASSISGIGSEAAYQEAEFAQISNSAIAETQSSISELEQRIASLQVRASQAGDARDAAENKARSLEEQVYQTQETIRGLESRLVALEDRLSVLQSELANADDEVRDAVQQQINQVHSHISECSSDINTLNDRKMRYEQEHKREIAERDEQERIRKRCEDQTYSEGQRKSKYEAKLSRLSVQSRRASGVLGEFSSIAKNYESTSSGTSERAQGSLGRCICLIEEWDSAQL